MHVELRYITKIQQNVIKLKLYLITFPDELTEASLKGSESSNTSTNKIDLSKYDEPVPDKNKGDNEGINKDILNHKKSSIDNDKDKPISQNIDEDPLDKRPTFGVQLKKVEKKVRLIELDVASITQWIL